MTTNGGPVLGQMRDYAAAQDRLLSTTTPSIGSVGGERTWGAMTPNFGVGSKRAFGGSDLMSEFTKIARSYPSEAPETRLTPSMAENETIRITRYLAENRDLPSSGSNLQYFPVWVRPAVDPMVSDVHGLSTEEYMRNLLVSDRYGNRVRGTGGKGYRTQRDTRVGSRVEYKFNHATVATINHFLQSAEVQMEEDMDVEFEEVIPDWRFDGVINNQTTNMDKYGAPLGTGEDSNVSVEIHGPANIVNYWGPKATIGMRLYFIAKRVDRSTLPTRFVAGLNGDAVSLNGDPSASGRKSIDAETARDTGLVDRPFQLSPYIGTGAPDYDDLMYYDSFGIPREGYCIYIGQVWKGSSRIIHSEYTDQACYNDESANSLSRIWVFLGVE